jgi:hypothetical protein
MTNAFIFSALPNDSIRLLTFSSTAAGDLICTMKNVVFANCPRFYALSYSWGSDASCVSISCNGFSINIRASLHDAIHTLLNLPLNPELPIWIDAICINQEDDEEKAVQVSRMGDIYRTAHQVLAWLGPSGKDSDLAMHSLETLSKALPPIFTPPQFSQLEALCLPKRNSPVWSALGHLFRRTWFGRLWTFQEAVLASDLLIICGRKTISSKILFTVTKELKRLSLNVLCVQNQPPMEIHEDGFYALEVVNFVKRALNEEKALDFPDLLDFARAKVCSDPRDRVFAMLGMAGKGFQDRIQIAYSKESAKDAIQTYIHCAKACIEEGMPMILELVGRRQRIPDLPSWCPNLDVYTEKAYGQMFRPWHRAGISDDLMPNDLFHARTTTRDNNLDISGFRMDTVSECIEPEYPGHLFEHIQQPVSWARKYIIWEAQCLALAQRTRLEVLPVEHALTLVGHTRQRLPHVGEKDLLQAYLDSLVIAKNFALNRDSIPYPEERVDLFTHTYKDITGTCAHRRYFSTENGRLGVGPLDIKKGDTVCVLYGTRPVYILRETEVTGEWLLIGGAYVYGLMDLTETVKNARGTDEVFTIV